MSAQGEVSERALERVEEIVSGSGFTKDLGIEFVSMRMGECVLRIKIEDRHLNPLNMAHGGVLFTLADTAAGLAAATRDGGGPTLEANYSFWLPATKGIVTCTGKITKYGAHVIWTKALITDEQGRELGVARFVYYNLNGAQEDYILNVKELFADNEIIEIGGEEDGTTDGKLRDN